MRTIGHRPHAVACLLQKPDDCAMETICVILCLPQCAKVASLSHAQRCEDAAGMTCMYYLAQDLRRAVFSLVSLHFKVKPVP